MPRPLCKGSGEPGDPLDLTAYAGKCRECGETFRLNASGRVFNHKTPAAATDRARKTRTKARPSALATL